MAIVNVKGHPGFVYNDENIQELENEEKYVNAYFDEKRAKELGVSPEEITKIEKGDTVMLITL